MEEFCHDIIHPSSKSGAFILSSPIIANVIEMESYRSARLVTQ